MLQPPSILASLLARIRPVETEQAPLAQSFGRALAQEVLADRDSPPCDVSAVDGYAVRLKSSESGVIAVAFDVAAGVPAPVLPAGFRARVMTGAPVPAGAEAMVPREKTDESDPLKIRLLYPEQIRAGDNIRRAGENMRAGEIALQAGSEINSTVAGSLSLLGVATPRLFRRIKIAVLITGDEVLDASSIPKPWQVRDANGPALAALFHSLPWVEKGTPLHHVGDELATLKIAVESALSSCDALLLTGGVSAGDLDFVPRMLEESGCEILFHKLAIRPGKPLLGAVTKNGRPVFGLPGNPVAVMTCARRFAMPALRARAGLQQAHGALVKVMNADDKTLELTWFRPVKLVAPGEAQLTATKGSGDPIGASRGDGFVEVAPGQLAGGYLPYFAW